MKLLNTDSLAATVDAVNEAFFLGKKIPSNQRDAVAAWIAARQGIKGSYAGMFAPTRQDFSKGIFTFTGERITTRAGVAHVLGEEACRALAILKAPAKDAKNALTTANANMIRRLGPGDIGTYCCGRCSCAYWRNLLVGGLVDQERRLKAGVAVLKTSRNDGRWRRFPFYYALLALNEMDFPSAIAEMRYVAPILERSLKRPAGESDFSPRRRLLAERILAKC